MDGQATSKRQRDDDEVNSDVEESRYLKRIRHSEPLFLPDPKDSETEISLRVTSAPRFVVPEFGASFFDPTIIAGPWDNTYKLTLPSQ
jgi:hypothetical protein